MKRNSPNRKAKQRKSRRLQRTVSYRQGLIEAIRKYFPAPFFSRWKLRHGLLWTPQRLFWMAILMVWSAEQTLQDRFDAVGQLLASLFPRWKLGTSYTGWYEAQLAWLEPLQPAAAQRLRQQMQMLAGPHWLREGWCAFAADGSRIECPRTAANQAELGCAGRKKTGPQLFLTTLWHMGLGLPWDYRIGPGTASERRHLEAMLPELPAAALLVADAGFTGYDLLDRIQASRRHFLVRVGANVHLLRKLGYWEHEDRDTVYLWPDNRQDRPPLVLRLLVLGQGRRRMHLLTNVLDAKALPPAAAAALYEMRWGVEVFYRTTKQTLQKRKMLSRTPAAARSELMWAVLGVWLLGLMSVGAIVERGGDPLRWSAAAARRQVRRCMQRAQGQRRPGRTLQDELAAALRDDYERTGRKKARDWPHKKREKPPGNPKITLASKQEIRRAKKVKHKNEVT